jgi:hypothetical protein
MSVVARVTGVNGGRSGVCCLVKGSPEAIKTLIRQDKVPKWYEEAHRGLEEKGA